MHAQQFFTIFALSMVGTNALDFDQMSKVTNSGPALFGRQAGMPLSPCVCTTCKVTTPGKDCCGGGINVACCSDDNKTCACCVGGSCGCVGCQFGCKQ